MKKERKKQKKNKQKGDNIDYLVLYNGSRNDWEWASEGKVKKILQQAVGQRYTVKVYSGRVVFSSLNPVKVKLAIAYGKNEK